MDKKSSPSVIGKLAAALAVCLAFWALDRFALPHPIFKVVSMAALVLFCAGLLVLIFGAIKVASHRGRTVLTILSSLTRYVAAIVIPLLGSVPFRR